MRRCPGRTASKPSVIASPKPGLRPPARPGGAAAPDGPERAAVDREHVDPARMVERVDRRAGRVGRREQRAPHHPRRRDVEADLAQPPGTARVDEPDALLVEALRDQPVARVEVVRRAGDLHVGVALHPERVERAQHAPVPDPPRLERARAPAPAAPEVLLGDRHDPRSQPHGVVVDEVVVGPDGARAARAEDEPRMQRPRGVVGGRPARAGDPRESVGVDLHVVRAVDAGRLLGGEPAGDPGVRRVAQVDDVDSRRRAGEPRPAARVDAGDRVPDAAPARGREEVGQPARPRAERRDHARARRVADVDDVEHAAAAVGVVGDEHDPGADVDVLVLHVGQVEPADPCRGPRVGDVEDRSRRVSEET